MRISQLHIFYFFFYGSRSRFDVGLDLGLVLE